MSTANILLFGESGAGKSTSINAIANYLHYDTFDQAAAGEFVQVVPSRISLVHPITNKSMIIGDTNQTDSNERSNDTGHSVTQGPKSYELKYGARKLCVIDTPGMGDTRGQDVDKENFQQIIAHLRNFDQLHAICFLIKTTVTRKTAVFQYCLNQLLRNLPRNAFKNLVFCFTFSRNSRYGVGDGFQTLKSCLDENLFGLEPIELKVGGNCFFIDNEAFRFLLARRHGFPFSSEIENQYGESWDKSGAQATAMINRIMQMEPFRVNELISMVQSRYVQTNDKDLPKKIPTEPVPKTIIYENGNQLDKESRDTANQNSKQSQFQSNIYTPQLTIYNSTKQPELKTNLIPDSKSKIQLLDQKYAKANITEHSEPIYAQWPEIKPMINPAAQKLNNFDSNIQNQVNNSDKIIEKPQSPLYPKLAESEFSKTKSAPESGLHIDIANEIQKFIQSHGIDLEKCKPKLIRNQTGNSKNMTLVIDFGQPNQMPCSIEVKLGQKINESPNAYGPITKTAEDGPKLQTENESNYRNNSAQRNQKTNSGLVAQNSGMQPNSYSSNSQGSSHSNHFTLTRKEEMQKFKDDQKRIKAERKQKKKDDKRKKKEEKRRKKEEKRRKKEEKKKRKAEEIMRKQEEKNINSALKKGNRSFWK